MCAPCAIFLSACAASAHGSARACAHGAREGAAACGGGRWPFFEILMLSILKFNKLDTIMAIRMIRSEKPGSDTTVGDPDPPPGEAAEEHRIKAGR
ncbi:hypothetical protein F511_41030 [Dorcoceras hygrometricum]|uniref:Uncharacterized protein n=1 Tax=Dorcoceras hygrometricum TaxID=472368 RepID=A0A2Z7BVN6_9LAMI|nr:hypothetical protein F511_41030 [Dorcoceras hygrometricum]